MNAPLLLHRVMPRPVVVTCKPANDDQALGGKLGTAIMLVVGCGIGFLLSTGGVW